MACAVITLLAQPWAKFSRSAKTFQKVPASRRQIDQRQTSFFIMFAAQVSVGLENDHLKCGPLWLSRNDLRARCRLLCQPPRAHEASAHHPFLRCCPQRRELLPALLLESPPFFRRSKKPSVTSRNAPMAVTCAPRNPFSAANRISGSFIFHLSQIRARRFSDRFLHTAISISYRGVFVKSRRQ